MKKALTILMCVFSLALRAQIVNITDENFKKGLIADGVDKNHDNKIQVSEALLVKSLYLNKRGIGSLEGIASFKNLTELICNDNNLYLYNLDLSQNLKLTNLECKNNKLTALDVSKNINLQNLDCGFNNLTTLDLSKNINLTKLDFFANKLTSLDVSANINLTELDCGRNALTSLDASKNIQLTNIECSENKLTSLNITQNINLTDFNCSRNDFNSLDASSNTKIKYINCEGNALLTKIYIPQIFDPSSGFSRKSSSAEWIKK